MKKFINGIKVSLATLWVSLISVFSKVMGQSYGGALLYWVPGPDGNFWIQVPSWVNTLPEQKMNLAIKIAQSALVGIIFIVWIINFIKIRKTGDKVQKKKKIKKTVIILAILVVILVAVFLVSALLLK